jgi:hypothetical protein
MLGFVTFGTPEQIDRAGRFIEAQGVRCAILKAEDGRTELMVIFDKRSTPQSAMSLYKRIERGEFKTKDTGYILVPRSSMKKP